MTTNQPADSTRQLSLNILTTIVVFVLNTCVAAFLTPYLVEALGVTAYGFVGLSTTVVGYASVLTIAVNSMAGRFVAVDMHRGAVDNARIYLSTAIGANLIFSVLILAAVSVTAVFLPDLVHIPPALVGDVRALFVLLGISFCINLFAGLTSVGAFIANRLDLTNLKSMGATVLRVIVIFVSFGFFVPRLWYLGMAAVVMASYTMYANTALLYRFTPVLKPKLSLFKIARLREVCASGMWHTIGRLSGILSKGFDLLFANVFISAHAAGLLSLAQLLPVMLLSLIGNIASSFTPEFTELFAHAKIELLSEKICRSIRWCGGLSALPLALLIAYGYPLYSLWLPTADPNELYILTLLISVELVVALPLEPLWSVFTITNRPRSSNLTLLGTAIATFGVVLSVMLFVDDNIIRLMVLAGTHSFFGLMRCLLFLPSYSARLLGLHWSTFFRPLLHSLVIMSIVTIFGFCCRIILPEISWTTLLTGAAVTTVVWIILVFGTDRIRLSLSKKS